MSVAVAAWTSREVPMLPGGFRRGADRLGRGQRVHDRVARKRTRDQSGRPREEEADAARPQRLAPPAPSQVDGEREETEGQDEQHDRGSLQEPHEILRQLELARAEDHDVTGAFRELLCHAPPDPQAALRPAEQSREVKRHVAAGRRNHVTTALDDLEQTSVGAPVRLLPQPLGNRPSEQVVQALLGERPQAAGGGPCQCARGCRSEDLLKTPLELGLHVHVRVQVGDEEVGDLGSDRIVL
jgi:hypothetical protein